MNVYSCTKNFSKEKQYYVNFHCHTLKSDGFCTAEELIERAIEQNAGATMILAVTDHNKLFDEFPQLQEKYKDKIILIPGCEISTTYVVPSTGRKIEVHIIALDYDLDNKELPKMLLKNHHDKRTYVEDILTKLETIGIHVADSYEELVEYAKPSPHVGRMVIARKMFENKQVNSIDEAFDKYFGSYGDRLCYVDNDFEFVSIEECVSTIIQSGGIPILCHPYFYDLTDGELLTLIKHFINAGGIAMETCYAFYTEEQQASLRKLCHAMGLKESAGSDYHGNAHERLDQHYPGQIAETLLNTDREMRTREE